MRQDTRVRGLGGAGRGGGGDLLRVLLTEGALGRIRQVRTETASVVESETQEAQIFRFLDLDPDPT